MKNEIRMLLAEFEAKENARHAIRDGFREDNGDIPEADYPAWDEMRMDQAIEAECDLQELLTLLSHALNDKKD